MNPDIKMYFFGPKPYLIPSSSINAIMGDTKALLSINDFLVSKMINDDSNEYAKRMADASGVNFFDIRQILIQGGNDFYLNGEYLYFDWNHWSQAGADNFYKKLSQTPVYKELVAP